MLLHWKVTWERDIQIVVSDNHPHLDFAEMKAQVLKDALQDVDPDWLRDNAIIEATGTSG